jgi:hypothetical protein
LAAKTEQALPRRLIVTYRALPGQPNFIAEFADWNLNIHPTDAEFVFQPPPDAVQVAMKPLPQTATASKAKGGRK